MDVFKQPKKSTYIWATFARKCISKNFQKSPNLVTLEPTMESFIREGISVVSQKCFDTKVKEQP